MNPIVCLQKIKYMDSVCLATVDNHGWPYTRCSDALHLEDDALYFFVPRGEPFTRALDECKRLQVIGLSRFNEVIKLTGIPTRLEGIQAEQRATQIFEERPEMLRLYPGDTRDIGVVYELRNMTIDYINYRVSPIFRESYALGDAQLIPRGYFITDACIECGKCIEVCPQGVIEDGTPYEIEQDHCLRCGACQEVCPAKAVQTIESTNNQQQSVSMDNYPS